MTILLSIALAAGLTAGPKYPQSGEKRAEVYAALQDGKITELGSGSVKAWSGPGAATADGKSLQNWGDAHALVAVRPNGDMLFAMKMNTEANVLSGWDIKLQIANQSKGFDEAITESATYTPTGKTHPETTIGVVVPAAEVKRLGLTPENAAFYGRLKPNPKYLSKGPGTTETTKYELPETYINKNSQPFANFGLGGK